MKKSINLQLTPVATPRTLSVGVIPVDVLYPPTRFLFSALFGILGETALAVLKVSGPNLPGPVKSLLVSGALLSPRTQAVVRASVRARAARHILLTV